MDRLADALDFLRKWFPEGVDLSFLDPLVRLIGMEDTPEAGQLLVLSILSILFLAAVYGIGRAVRGRRPAGPEPVEAEEATRSIEEIEAELERAVEQLPVEEEIEEAPEGPSIVETKPEIEEAPPVPEPVAEEAPAVAPAPPIEEPLSREGLFARLKRGLTKTKEGFLGRIDALVLTRKIDDALFEELEEILIQADLGVKTTYKLLGSLQAKADRGEMKDGQALRRHLKEEIRSILGAKAAPLDVRRAQPFVLLVTGVNGVGKTTTIGKLAKRFTDQGLSTMMVAGDTFRAAAIEQLEIWAGRVGADFIKQKAGADPAGVAFDGIAAAQARGTDVVILDTAGRLHTKVNLMEELKKVQRVVARRIPDAPHEVLLVLDANNGQNAIQQARQFHEALGVTGIILTKLDGTAKGGVIVGIADELGLPIRFIGIGERLDDLREFDPEEFVDALFAE